MPCSTGEYRDITVLDISETGMRFAQQRLGAQADHVQWLVADLLTWEPRAWAPYSPERTRHLRLLPGTSSSLHGTDALYTHIDNLLSIGEIQAPNRHDGRADV